MNDLEVMAGSGGSVLLDGTSANTQGYAILIVREDTVINAIGEKNASGDSSEDVLTARNLSSKTLTKGEYITPRKKFFDTFTMASGSVMAYLYIE